MWKDVLVHRRGVRARWSWECSFFFIMNGNCVSKGESEGGEDAGNGKLVPGNALFGDL